MAPFETWGTLTVAVCALDSLAPASEAQDRLESEPYPEGPSSSHCRHGQSCQVDPQTQHKVTSTPHTPAEPTVRKPHSHGPQPACPHLGLVLPQQDTALWSLFPATTHRPMTSTQDPRCPSKVLTQGQGCASKSRPPAPSRPLHPAKPKCPQPWERGAAGWPLVPTPFCR